MSHGRATVVLSLLVLLGMTSCGGTTEAVDGPVATPTTVSPGEAVTSSAPAGGGALLPDGPLEAGRYRFVVSVDCEGVTDDPIACPKGVQAPPPIPLEVTVPDGWEHLPGFPVIRTLAEATGEEGVLVLGWTSNTVGINSDPCSSESHELPDVKVGPSVDDFVDAVGSEKRLNATAPVDAKVGGASGQYFTLKGPADLSKCFEWRPWDPGFYAQGPSNIWEVWVLDVDGHRVLIVTNYFPGTSTRTVAALRRMVESIRFPSS